MLPTIGNESQQTTGTLPPPKKDASASAAPAAPSDEDFERFKTFLRSEGIAVKRSSEKDIRELYARYIRWKAGEKRKAP